MGERYETEQVSLKPWPSRRTLHRTITAVLDVMAAHDLSFEQIAHVDVLVGAVNRPWCQPVRTGLVPRQRIDLLNNMLFAVGAAIRHRDVKLRLYCDPALADDVVTQAVPKVRWHDVGASGAGAISEPGAGADRYGRRSCARRTLRGAARPSGAADVAGATAREVRRVRGERGASGQRGSGRRRSSMW